MKKINFDIIFKIIVLIELTVILIIAFFDYSSNDSQLVVAPNEIGRFKDVKLKKINGFGTEVESVRILDTKTGEYVD